MTKSGALGGATSAPEASHLRASAGAPPLSVIYCRRPSCCSGRCGGPETGPFLRLNTGSPGRPDGDAHDEACARSNRTCEPAEPELRAAFVPGLVDVEPTEASAAVLVLRDRLSPISADPSA